MLQKTVPDPYSDDLKSSVAVGCESGMWNRHALWNADAFETR